MNSRKLGILTSGGDSPGMNAVLRAVVRTALYNKWIPFVIYEGYEGLVSGSNEKIKEFQWNDVSHIISMGGTIIGTARCELFRQYSGRKEAAKNLIHRGIDCLVVIGGDGSMTGAEILRSEWKQICKELLESNDISKDMLCEIRPFLSIVGVAGSIDNDMVGTEMTIGASSSLHRIIEAVDAISTSAFSHQRAFIIEVMGRHCGWLALMAATACGADYFLIPEQPVRNWKEEMCLRIKYHRSLGKRESIIIVSEGAVDLDNKSITSKAVANAIHDVLGLEARVTTLGHVQRGGKPSAYDRIIGTLMGVHAAHVLINRNDEYEGLMIGVQENQIVTISLQDAVKITKSIGEAMEQKDFDRAFNLRDPDFRECYRLLKSLHPRIDSFEKPKCYPILAIVNIGAPAAGMNCVVYTFVQYLISMGGCPLAIYGGWNANDVRPLSWIDVDGWMSSGGCNLGTHRMLPDPAIVSKLFESHKIDGCIIVGGYEALLSIKILANSRTKYPFLNIPMIMIPATISNNVPGSHYSIGSDTALNMITTCCDVVRQSAASSMKRAFVVEIQGGNCGFLTQMGGIASGAMTSYIPEIEQNLSDIHVDMELLKKKFTTEERPQGRLILVNENVSIRFLNIDTLAHIFTLEGNGLFDARTCKLGHLQQGSSPSPYDRIFAVKMTALAVDDILKSISNRSENNSIAIIIGIQNGQVCKTSIMQEEFIRSCDDIKRVPRHTWWIEYRSIARMLSNHSLTREEQQECMTLSSGHL